MFESLECERHAYASRTFYAVLRAFCYNFLASPRASDLVTVAVPRSYLIMITVGDSPEHGSQTFATLDLAGHGHGATTWSRDKFLDEIFGCNASPKRRFCGGDRVGKASRKRAGGGTARALRRSRGVDRVPAQGGACAGPLLRTRGCQDNDDYDIAGELSQSWGPGCLPRPAAGVALAVAVDRALTVLVETKLASCVSVTVACCCCTSGVQAVAASLRGADAASQARSRLGKHY